MLGFLNKTDHPLTIENEVDGEALIALQHDDLKQMGIVSVGHRLTILKGIYDVKRTQDIPIENDHYIPLSTYMILSTLLNKPIFGHYIVRERLTCSRRR